MSCISLYILNIYWTLSILDIIIIITSSGCGHAVWFGRKGIIIKAVVILGRLLTPPPPGVKSEGEWGVWSRD